MRNPRVSVIIRCFNEAKHIGTLLERVYTQTVSDPEVVVVDSGSTDRTLEIVTRYPVRLVRISPREFTFGYSLNQGCRAATGEFLAIASAHVIPLANNWLERLIAPFSDPAVGLVYGRQVGDHRTRFSEQQLFAKQFPAISNQDQRSPFCNNANAAIRGELWRKQPYDETLSGLEDLAWAKWVLGQGFKLAYSADAVIAHIHEETPAIIKRRYMREAIALKRIFPDSHVTLVEFLGLLVSNVTMDILAAVRSAQLRSAADIVMFRTMQYWGMYRGMNNRSPMTRELIAQFYYPRRFRTPASPKGMPPVLTDSYDGSH
jgi:glycosyltransferase involved in cell wall biosynthesis